MTHLSSRRLRQGSSTHTRARGQGPALRRAGRRLPIGTHMLIGSGGDDCWDLHAHYGLGRTDLAGQLRGGHVGVAGDTKASGYLVHVG